METNQQKNQWYEKTWLVVLLCIIFFPIGLYALWKNTSIKKGWKIGVTAFFVIVIIVNLSDRNDNNPSTKELAKFHAKDSISNTPEARKRDSLNKIAKSIEVHREDSILSVQESAYCKTPAGKIWKKHQDWDKDICEVIANHKVRIGMTKEQCLAAWGKPESVNITTTADGSTEQWVYNMSSFLYFDNGVLTTIQN